MTIALTARYASPRPLLPPSAGVLAQPSWPLLPASLVTVIAAGKMGRLIRDWEVGAQVGNRLARRRGSRRVVWAFHGRMRLLGMLRALVLILCWTQERLVNDSSSCQHPALVTLYTIGLQSVSSTQQSSQRLVQAPLT